MFQDVWTFLSTKVADIYSHSHPLITISLLQAAVRFAAGYRLEVQLQEPPDPLIAML